MNNGNPRPFVSKTGSSKEIQMVPQWKNPQAGSGKDNLELEKSLKVWVYLKRIVFTNFCESKAKQPLNHHIHRGAIEKSEHFLTMIIF